MKRITFNYDNGTGIITKREGYPFEHFGERFLVFKSRCLINSATHWFVVHQRTRGMFEFTHPLPETRKDAMARTLEILNRIGKERALKHIEAFTNTRQLQTTTGGKNG